MRFTLYSEKTVPQSLSALNARLQAKATATRPALDGWIDRGGDFSLEMSAPVIGKFRRTTRLTGHIERQPGATVIRGTVPGGSSPRERAVALGALVVLGVIIAVFGRPLLGLLLVPVGFWLYVPLAGDYVNGPALIGEVQRTLKAKATPPKAAKVSAAPVKSAAAPRPAKAASASATTPKPAAKPAPSASAPVRPAPKPTAPAPRPVLSRSILDEDEGDDRDDIIHVNEDVQPKLL